MRFWVFIAANIKITVFRDLVYLEDGRIIFFRNVDTCLTNYKES
jgi:hypothetical protein